MRRDDILHKLQRARRRQHLTPAQYLEGIRKGNRTILGRAITLVESDNPKHQRLARELLGLCLPFSGHAFRLGITGVPGVGKSTFVEALGRHVLGQGHRLAVLAVDPTSGQTGGSILGDKTRMQWLSAEERAFIRPSPAGNSLGGVARKTREVGILCEAAGYDLVFIETVGVGQSETAVHSMVDFFLLLLLPGGGDELQGIKRGIVEMADMIAVNKADTNPMLAKQAKQAYRNAVHLFPPKDSGWAVKSVLCSALKMEGIEALWQHIRKYDNFTKENGFFLMKRQQQAGYWFQQSIGEGLLSAFRQHPVVAREMPLMEKAVEEGRITPFAAAEQLLSLFRESGRM